MDATSITVGLGERSYPIYIGPGVLSMIGADLKARQSGQKYGIITDSNVGKLYGNKLLQGLKQEGIEARLFIFTAGEGSKNLETIGQLASSLAQEGFDRSDALIALGGGVAGDMTGFLAATYMRGIPFVQVPTSLLAQVDSSVGGKTGVDIPEGKNLVGAFYQPQAVYIDTDLLDTLPQQEYRGGLAEVIKYGVIQDSSFFTFLKNNHKNIKQLEPGVLTSMIQRCCEIKADVVAQDEREGGLRRILNYGHTIGHAVEAASDFTIIHGFAVAIGMVAAAKLAPRSLDQGTDISDELTGLLQTYGLPTTIPAELNVERMRKYLLADKKTVGGRVFFVLPDKIGSVRITDKVNVRDVDAVLSNAL
ncbi:3-dehydroquinate synthase [Desulfogranum japonicum]|uniref:3-dehydroquinate synthase n=1 Tax=Desulfogranum japonicum TaxID=231447 RepID=UPI00040B2B1B|nr:3-dehydroquinate synthase [Desulfogranum japonicum]